MRHWFNSEGKVSGLGVDEYYQSIGGSAPSTDRPDKRSCFTRSVRRSDYFVEPFFLSLQHRNGNGQSVLVWDCCPYRKMLSGTNASAISDIERMSIGAHQPGGEENNPGAYNPHWLR